MNNKVIAINKENGIPSRFSSLWETIINKLLPAKTASVSNIDQQYKELINELPGLICKIKPNGTVTLANNTFLVDLGMSEEEVLGTSIWDFIPKEEHARMKEGFANLKSPQDIFTHEQPTHKANGNLVIQEWTNKGLFDSNGKLIEIMATGVDITKRKNIEESLRISEETTRKLFNTSPDPVAINRQKDGLYVDVNDKFIELLGYSHKELIGKKSIALSIWKYSNARDKLVEELQKKSHTTNIETTFCGKNKKEIIGSMSASSIMIGREPHIISITRDIRQQKQAEEALKASEVKFKNIFDNIQIPYYETSLDGIILELSPSIEKISQYTREELIGTSILDLYSTPKEREAFLTQLFKTNELVDYEINLKDKDGSIKTVSLFVKILTDSNGTPIKMGGSMQDISERKQSEEEKKRYTQELEKINKTLKQTQKSLLHAEKMKSIGDLAGGIAHDFNNILSPIIGYADILREDSSKDSEQWANADEIYQAGIRASELVKQLLSFSQQEQNAKFENIKLSKVLTEVLKLIRASLNKNINIESEISDKNGVIFGNQSQLHSIILNLCRNAADAMEENGGTLSIKLDTVHLKTEDLVPGFNLKEGPHVKLEISDTGEGIDPKIMNKIFEPYFTTKETEKGTGLGLAIIYKIVQAYKGAITVESMLGKGTQFSILLPQTHLPETKKIVNKAVLSLAGTERILLADDEPAILKLTKRRLEKNGYTVTTADNGNKLLEILAKNPSTFDMILTDMQMPGIDGAKVAAEAKKIREDIPIILCTGFSKKIDKTTDISKLGFSRILRKPTEMNDMLLTIRSVFDPEIE